MRRLDEGHALRSYVATGKDLRKVWSMRDFIQHEEVEHVEALRLRERFIDSFENKEHPMYKVQIATRRQFEDGDCYIGYLWDYLKDNELYELECSMEQACDYLRQKGAIYVMQDIHSRERENCPCVFSAQFSKDAVLKMDGRELADRIPKEWSELYWKWSERFFPEDIYCFDDSMDWFVIFTHEGWDQITAPDRGLGEEDYIRICFVKRGVEA